jgi:hypothetical protein
VDFNQAVIIKRPRPSENISDWLASHNLSCGLLEPSDATHLSLRPIVSLTNVMPDFHGGFETNDTSRPMRELS